MSLALESGLLLAAFPHVLLYYSEIVDVLPLVKCGSLYSLYLTLLSIATTDWATFFFNNHHFTQVKTLWHDRSLIKIHSQDTWLEDDSSHVLLIKIHMLHYSNASQLPNLILLTQYLLLITIRSLLWDGKLYSNCS